MKHFVQILTISALLPLSVVCSAEETKEPAMMTGGMAMGSDTGPMDPAKLEEHLKERQEHLLKMHDLSNKILAETDPQKQQALKNQQLELMKAEHANMMSKHMSKPMHHKKMP